MRTPLLFFIMIFGFAGFSQSAAAQAKSMQQLLQDKGVEQTKPKGGGMRSMHFKSNAPEIKNKEDSTSLKSLGNGVTEIPAEEPVAPEEDVWKKYEALASGIGNSPQSGQMGQKTLSSESDAPKAAPDKAKEQPVENKEEKGFMTQLMENYKNREQDKGKIYNKRVND